MNLDETIKEAKVTAVLYENEARECIQHGGSFYEERAKVFRESAKEFEQVAEWLEELKAYRVADRPKGEWIDKGADLDGTWYYQCSNCHMEVIEEQYPNCPYCLARMKGADDETD